MEVMVGVYFVIVDGVFFVYMFFNKGVFGFWYYWGVICGSYYINGVLGEMWIVDDFCVGIFFEECFC